MRMRSLQIMVNGRKNGYYLCVYRIMKYISTSREIIEPTIVTIRVSTSIIVLLFYYSSLFYGLD